MEMQLPLAPAVGSRRAPSTDPYAVDAAEAGAVEDRRGFSATADGDVVDAAAVGSELATTAAEVCCSLLATCPPCSVGISAKVCKRQLTFA